MTGAYSVDLDELAVVLERMARCHAALQGLAGDVEAEVAALHADWSGLAREAHGGHHAGWSAGFTAMREALGVMRSAGRAAHDHYLAATDANLAMWRQVG